MRRCVACSLLALVALLAGPHAVAGTEGFPLQDQIQEREYEVSFQPGLEVHQAPNRAQGFRTSFEDQGIRLQPRLEAERPWEWGLTWAGYGRGSQTAPVPAAALSVRGNRVDYRRSSLAEWYENSHKGLKQGFLLGVPPEELVPGSGDGPASPEPLHVDLALTGTLSPIVAADGQSIDFVAGDGTRVLRYAALVVTDAQGRQVRSWMEASVDEAGRRIRLVVDAGDAPFPLTIDPLATSPVWTFESNQGSAALGASVATAGDVNGDGYADLAIGAPLFDNGQTNEGRVFVWLGSASGPSASWTSESDLTGDATFGASVAAAGDVNGDGYGDVLVGAPGYDNGQTNEGRAYLFLGSAAGLSVAPSWTWESNVASASAGFSVGSAGDVNGDGYADVVVGANTAARAYVFQGSPSGLAAAPVWTATGPAGSNFGGAVATAGDVNGDGYADVLVGASNYGNGQVGEGAAYVYHGSVSGPSPTASWFREGDWPTAALGVSVGTAGDVNADGYSDVILGANLYANGQSGEGRAFVFLGSLSGLSAFEAWTGEVDVEGAHYGFSVGTAGDVNGDGYADFVVAADQISAGPLFIAGRAYLYLGGPFLSVIPVWQCDGPQSGGGPGMAVAGAGDVNGDGYADVVVGFRSYDNGQTDEGLAQVFLGSGTHLSLNAWVLQGAANSDYLEVRAAGDVNGDGYDDALGQVRSPFQVQLYPGSATGPATTPAMTLTLSTGDFTSLARGAGDVNGDGYGDLIVGDHTGPINHLAKVHLGSPGGWATTPIWTLTGPADSEFANTVASAGDINGDGYGDVLVGEPAWQGTFSFIEAGRLHLYLGSPSGPVPSPSGILQPVPEGQWARVGASIAAAGDVNGDGYGDVVVGAPKHSSPDFFECGRVFVYAGAPNGSVAIMKVLGGPGLDVSAGRLGSSVAGAGDVNGDGYADILVTAQMGANLPRAYLFLGGPEGPSSTPVWSVAGTQANTGFANTVSSAGDVNGDGYADLLVSHQYYDAVVDGEGRALLFLGSASGPSTAPAWITQGSGVNDALSSGLETMGDVNGDGYADVGVSAIDAAGGYRGRAQIFYGNGGTGVALRPIQRRADDSVRIAYGGSAAANAFRVGLLGKTPFGRGKVRLEAELKPLGTPFNGLGTLLDEAGDTGTTGMPLQIFAQDLNQLNGYQWRVRLRYDPASFPLATRSRWITLPWGGWRETKVRTGPAPAVGAGRASGLIVFKVGLGVTVNWASDSGCVAEDSYEIYEGTLGDFTSHLPIACSTGVSHTWNFTPGTGNRYFMIVPRNANVEGSYGKRRDGSERPASITACLPHMIGCP